MLIGLTGGRGVGKTEVARIVVDSFGAKRVSFADPLKNMLAALGLSEQELYGDRKNVPLDALCGKTSRYAMQTLGTEWGRDLIGPDIWTRQWRSRVLAWQQKGFRVVTDDLRFENEEIAFRKEHGIVIEVVRDSSDTEYSGIPNHRSETYIIEPDMTLLNQGSREELEHNVRKLFDFLL